MTPSLKDIVTARLADLRRNPFEAARIAGLERGFINDILAGKKRSVRGENLEKLAIGLDCDPDYLLGRQNTAKLSFSKHTPGVVYIRGEVAAGMWLDAGLDGWDTCEYEPSPFPPDGRFPTDAQFDLIVRGTSINRFAKDGQRLRCVSADTFPYQIQDNDIVIVERYRGDLRERTAKRWRRRNNVVELWPDSDDERWQAPLKVSEETSLSDGDEVRIFGLVLYVYDTPRRMR